jgi:hypothetical protein
MVTREGLEQQVKDNRKLVQLKDAALKLNGNREFRALIREEYLVQEAARTVQLSTDPRLNDKQRADALGMAQATGHLKRFLQITEQMGYAAEKDIADCEEQLAEIEQMEAGGYAHPIDDVHHNDLER